MAPARQLINAVKEIGGIVTAAPELSAMLFEHASLTHGIIPIATEVIGMALLVWAVVSHHLRWLRVWLPITAACGVIAAASAHWYLDSAGIISGVTPLRLWFWVAATASVPVLVVAGWRHSRWSRRAVALTTVVSSLLCAVTTANAWLGYLPTVGAAWTGLVGGPLPDQLDPAKVAALRGTQVPARGTVMTVSINPSDPHFRHRDELVYLPPAWFSSPPPAALPVVMMIGGEFNSPPDWIRAGDAITTVDRFAAEHQGNAPVLAFVDAGGAFDVDTECVNGPRGNSADHLVRDVVPYLVTHLNVSSDPRSWGVAGFSAGGTCAIDLTVMHPERFATFLDIAGDRGPNAGDKAQTVDRLFGGSVQSWTAFDPVSVMARHGRYTGIAGTIVVSGATNDGRGLHGGNAGEAAAAAELRTVATANGIACDVALEEGRHDWPFAGRAFAAKLPWLAGRLGIGGAGAGSAPPGTAPTTPRPRPEPALEASPSKHRR
jgi:S-formylglutathione hydrolase FrmB